MQCPLDISAATRPHPGMNVNGDDFVIKKWDHYALAGVIDGLGHGKFAYHAAQKARHYVESHFDQPLEALFRGVGRSCRATRGVVMALALLDWTQANLNIASIGNIEIRILGCSNKNSIYIRRGILGAHAPTPIITEHDWEQGAVMVLHSDGITTHWRYEDFLELWNEPASEIARQLLRKLAKNNDDATVLVVKNII